MTSPASPSRFSRADVWRVLFLVALAAASFAAGDFLGSAQGGSALALPTSATSDLSGGGSSLASETARENMARLWTAAQQPQGAWRTYQMAEAIEQLDAAQVREALEASRKLHDPLAEQVIRLLMVRWQKLDPDGLAAWAKPHFLRMSGTKAYKSWAGTVGQFWFRLAPNATDAALANSESESQDELLSTYWFLKNKEALARGEDVKFPASLREAFRDELSKNAAKAMAKKDPVRALSHARQVKMKGLRLDALASIFETWSRSDAPAALAALREELGGVEVGLVRLRMVDGVFKNLAASKSADALAEADKLPPEWRRYARETVVRERLSTDLLPALTAAYEQGDIFRLGPGGSVEVTPDAPPLAQKAALINPQVTSEWLRSLPKDHVRDALLGQAFPHVTSQAHFHELTPEWQQEHAYRFGQWVWKEEEKLNSLDWLARLSAGETRLRAIEGWASTGRPFDADPSLSTFFPSGPDRDAALLGTISSIQKSDRAEKLTRMAGLAAQITEPGIRDRARRRIAAEWLSADEAAAQRWMAESSGLSGATQQMLLRRHEKKPTLGSILLGDF